MSIPNVRDIINAQVLKTKNNPETVTGPGSSTANGLAKFSDANGKILKDSLNTILLDNGRLGLGISPVAKFHIFTGGLPQVKIENPAGTGIQILFSDTGNRSWLWKIDTTGMIFRDSDGGVDVLFLREGGDVGIGGAPAASAKLDIQGTNGALLLSRLTTTERDALTPSNGMLIYNTTLNKFQGRENGAWVNLI